jgi:hypothetical protein
MTAKRIGLLAVALLAGARGGAAQEPAGPPPPSSRVEDRGTTVLELLPAIGRIGAQAGLIAGLSRNPYRAGRGLQAAGYLDVPAGTRGGLSLVALREAQQQLVHAHAEGLPALGDAGAVAVLARHMVDASRHLTVIDLWIEAEELRG